MPDEDVDTTATFGDHAPSGRKVMDQVIDSAEWYERGVALRKAGLFKQAIQQFEKAANDLEAWLQKDQKRFNEEQKRELASSKKK